MAAIDFKKVPEFVIVADNRQHQARLLDIGTRGEFFFALTGGAGYAESSMRRHGVVCFEWEGKRYCFCGQLFCPSPFRLTVLRSSPIIEDRRKERRLDTQFLQAQVSGKGLFHGTIQATVLDICHNGMRIETHQALQQGTEYDVDVTLKVKHFSSTFRSPCCVLAVHEKRGIYHSCAMFHDTQTSDRTQLDKFLAETGGSGKDHLNV